MLRSLAVVLGLVLLAGAGVGLLTAFTAARHDRDATVMTLAEVAATDLAGLVDRTVLAAALATEPGEFERAIMLIGPFTVTEAGLRDPAVPTGLVEFGAEGDTVVVIAAGDTVLGSVELSVDVLRERVGRHDVTLSILPAAAAGPIGLTPAERRATPWSSDEGRTYSVPVEGVVGWAVVATVPDSWQLEPARRNRLLATALAGLLLVVLAAIALDSQQRRLLERATVDPLTQLPNRSELERRGTTMIDLALRAGDGACVMVVDLDGFKRINDTHGHPAGDEVLRVVGMRLRHAIRGYDLVARWGGDEFVVVLSGVSDPRIASARAAALASSVARPIEPRSPTAPEASSGSRRSDIDGSLPMERLQVGASIGLAMLGTHGHQLSDLLAAADAAMYEAKRTGVDHAMAATPTLTPCSAVMS